MPESSSQLGTPPLRSIARMAYERYCREAGCRSIRGRSLKFWEELPESIKKRWVAAIETAFSYKVQTP